MSLRPAGAINRLFLRYNKGKCVNQPIGKNTIGGMPSEVADYLKLPQSKEYTGHCFRRSGTTLLADTGADITAIMRFGGWKSPTVAASYIGESRGSKRKTFHSMTEEMSRVGQAFKKHLVLHGTSVDGNMPSTSRNYIPEKSTEDPRENSPLASTTTTSCTSEKLFRVSGETKLMSEEIDDFGIEFDNEFMSSLDTSIFDGNRGIIDSWEIACHKSPALNDLPISLISEDERETVPVKKTSVLHQIRTVTSKNNNVPQKENLNNFSNIGISDERVNLQLNNCNVTIQMFTKQMD